MMVALSEGGAIGIAGVVIVALIGYLGTRGTDSSKMAGEYSRMIMEDNQDLRTRIEALEEENRKLSRHVDRCDADNDQLRQRVSSLEAVLRRGGGDPLEYLD